MDRRARLTPFGAALIVVLVAAIVAVIVGSRVVQAIGAIVVVVVVLVLAGDQLPRLRLSGRVPADTLPSPERDRRRARRGSDPNRRPPPTS